ncbi:MAG: DUF4349 domain-containing protein [Oscillospiraceae bacterium]|nr:DUF4349 domain-containing protein [Oscillospiraceae bacterium]
MKRSISILMALAMVLCIFTGCGASSNLKDFNQSADMAVTEGFDGGWYDVSDDVEWIEEEWAVEDDVALEEAPMMPSVDKSPDTSGNVDADSLPASERKIIKNKSMDVQTTDLNAFVEELKKQVTALGGYIENSSNYKESADFTLRIPAENYDAFSAVVGNLGTVTYENEYIDDVTSQYIDIEARLKALRTEQESYLRLMEKAETVEEILQIQSYLSNVNYQIESYTAQLNSYKSKISYSTIRVNVVEVERVVTVTEKPTVFERISSRLSDNLYDIGEDAKDLFVDFVSSLPYIAIWAVIILVCVIILKLIFGNRKKKKAKSSLTNIQKPESEIK